MTTKTIGANELIRDLRNIEKKELESVVWGAIERGGEKIRRDAIRRAPEDTGALKRSIRCVKHRKSLGVKVEADYPKHKGRKQRKTKGKGWVYYAFAVEYGTKDRPAQPFLRPAFNAKEEEIARDIETAIGRAIDYE